MDSFISGSQSKSHTHTLKLKYIGNGTARTIIYTYHLSSSHIKMQIKLVALVNI